MFLDANADIRTQWNGDMAVLSQAAQRGHKNVVRMLFAANAKVNSYENCTALMHAARQGCAEIVQILLDADAEVDRDYPNGTALMYAAEKGYEDVVAMLIRANADVNHMDNSKRWTPFLCAAKNGRHKVMHMLFLAGAKWDFRETLDEFGGAVSLQSQSTLAAT